MSLGEAREPNNVRSYDDLWDNEREAYSPMVSALLRRPGKDPRLTGFIVPNRLLSLPDLEEAQSPVPLG